MRWTFGPDDYEQAEATIQALTTAFEADTGYDGWVGYQLLNLKWAYLDGRLNHWRSADLDEVLTEIFPRKVMLDDADINGIPADAKAFVRWLSDTHGLVGDPLPRLLAWLDRSAPAIIAAQRDTSRFSMGKLLTAQMQSTGVELTDASAVEQFISDFNARPQSEREALLPLPGEVDSLTGVALPPLVPLDDEALDRAALDAPMFRWLAGFAEYVGDGKALTKKGNLRLADGRLLVERLGTGDEIDPSPREGLTFTTRSTEELANLDLTFRVARAAGFVKVRQQKVSATKRAAALKRTPGKAWLLVVGGLLDVGILDHRYRHQQYFVPPWTGLLDEELRDVLVGLYAAAEPVEIEELADTYRRIIQQEWDLQEPEDTDYSTVVWWRMPEDNVRLQLTRLAELGVCRIQDVTRVANEYDGEDVAGGTVELTAAGHMAVANIARDRGMEVAEAGQFVGLSAAGLVAELAAADETATAAEVTAWLAARSGGGALAEVVGMLAEGQVDPDQFGTAAHLLVEAMDQAGVEEAEPIVAVLLDDVVFGPVIAGWLAEHDRDPGPEGPGLHAGLISLAAVGSADEAVVLLEQMGNRDRQTMLIEQIRAEHGPAAVPFFTGVADLHTDKAVAKAARKALFRLGVRR